MTRMADALARACAMLALTMSWSSLAAAAQTRPAGDDDAAQLEQTPTAPPSDAGGVARSTVGIAGQRQIRDQAPAGVQPLTRIAGRIENRVQNRVRNRIDRDYGLQATASPFAAAERRTRVRASRRR